MPRRLPWMVPQHSSLISSPKRRIASPMPAQKRTKVSEIESESDKETTPTLSRKTKPQAYAVVGTPPSSPPPDRLPEIFMREGMGNDDKYRMVEDEFLAIAKDFTVHLHAAEYKRQEKTARARNAETINSISRPVTQKMSDNTRRKVQGVDRSKTQQNAIHMLLGNKTETAEDPESSDGEGLAYFNTTLRGLMDSPRREAASLGRLPCEVATRAAAGFQKPAAHRNQDFSQAAESPRPKSSLGLGLSPRSKQDSATESSDFQDDLDVSVPAARYVSRDNRPVSTSSSLSSSLPHITQRKSVAAHKPAFTQLRSDEGNNVSISNTMPPESDLASPDQAESRVRRRLLQARVDRQEVEKEKEDRDKKDLDLIPTFL